MFLTQKKPEMFHLKFIIYKNISKIRFAEGDFVNQYLTIFTIFCRFEEVMM